MPAHALLMLRSGNRIVPVGFDAALHALSQDGLHAEQDDLVFKDAEAAARATADRFRGAGNPTWLPNTNDWRDGSSSGALNSMKNQMIVIAWTERLYRSDGYERAAGHR